jgi:hypothetical protein
MLLQCAAVSAVLALLSLNCMSSGTMNGRLTLNVSDQPTWGPTGYDRVEYYYFPDIDAYYYVQNHQYVYLDAGTWRYSNSLPPSYGTFDVYHSYKVVINEEKPYARNEEHRSKYRSYKGVKDQPVIRDSHDKKYFVNKDHPEHDKWKQDNKH